MGKALLTQGVGKKPINTARSKELDSRPISRNPGHIKNKLKRSEVYGKYLLDKKKQKKDARLKRVKEAEELGEEVIKQTPRTLDNTREEEDTFVDAGDDEILKDEAEDEFSPYFTDEIRPKILITTRPNPSGKLFHFMHDLMRFIPNMFFYPRKQYSVKQICEYSTNKKFTHLIVLSEKSKVCNGMLVSHLRPSPAAETAPGIEAGPTAFFKVSNVLLSESIPLKGSPTDHVPELVLNGFSTRLGHRAGRFLGSLFPHNAMFKGRQVATFHCQRDYIFARHHRYIFQEGKAVVKETDKKKTVARLQELGPRFTLKMRWLQQGTFDTHFGEFEWFHKRKEMDTTRRKFHL